MNDDQAISPDSRLAATGSEDIILWDVKTEQIITRWDYPSYVWSLAWSPKTGRYLVSTHGDGSILIWDIVGRERIANLNQHGRAVTAVAFTPDGQRVIPASEDRSLIVWNPISGSKQGVLQGHDSRATSFAVAPDNTWKASLGFDETLIEWDLTTLKSRKTIATPMGTHAVAISPDNHRFALDAGLLAREGPACALVNYHDQHASSFTFTRDGRKLYGGGRRLLRVWDASNGRRLESVPAEEADAMSLSPDETRLVTGDLKGQLTLWRTQPLQPLVTIPAHEARIKQVAFAPDGQTIASVGDDKKLKLWQTQPLRFLKDIGEHSAPVLAVAFAPDGQQIAGGGQDRSVRVYTRRQTWFGRRWANDGLRLVTGSSEGLVWRWDVATQQKVNALKVGDSNVRSVAFSPNGEMLVGTSSDPMLRIWRAAEKASLIP